MSGRYLARLLEHLQRAPGGRAELEALGPGVESLMGWAESKGFGLTREEAGRLLESLRELSDDELDKVAGGEDAWGGTGGTSGTGGTGGTGGGGTTAPP